jgi:hypothetical protein
MIRGTTPTHIFNLPFDTALIDKIKITYAQNGVVVLTKEKADCKIDGNAVTVRLTQEDTLKFDASRVQIQVRVLTTGGDALASVIVTKPCEEVLEEGVL